MMGLPVPTDASELVAVGCCGGYAHLNLKVLALGALHAPLHLLCLELQNSAKIGSGSTNLAMLSCYGMAVCMCHNREAGGVQN